MKPYPTEVIYGLDNLGGIDFDERYVVPTKEALSSWLAYLEPHEFLYYYCLPDICQLDIAMSCNPFNALIHSMRGPQR